MATNGKATTVRAPAGVFRVRPTAQRVTVNVTRCLASAGGSWPVDAEVALNLRGLAANGRDSTEQVVGFRRVR